MAGLTTAPADTGTLTLAALPAGLPLDFNDHSGDGYIEAARIDFDTWRRMPPAFYTHIALRGDVQCAWRVWQMRTDQHGREWRCSWNAVVDDFGTLVEVAS